MTYAAGKTRPQQLFICLITTGTISLIVSLVFIVDHWSDPEAAHAYRIETIRSQYRQAQSAPPIEPPSKAVLALPEAQKSASKGWVLHPSAGASESHSTASESRLSSFAPFGSATLPVSQIPNWGAMRDPREWEKPYNQMDISAFIPVPAYDLAVLTTPMTDLIKPLRDENIAKITAKLFYSTRHFGAYHVDSGEFVAPHPGIDLKLPRGTPIGAVAGGLVHDIGRDVVLGRYIIIEHRIPQTSRHVFSVYGHLDDTYALSGDAVQPGQVIGTVGMSGLTTAPHLHLQIDKKRRDGLHHVYRPDTLPRPAIADRYTIHPIEFISTH